MLSQYTGEFLFTFSPLPYYSFHYTQKQTSRLWLQTNRSRHVHRTENKKKGSKIFSCAFHVPIKSEWTLSTSLADPICFQSSEFWSRFLVSRQRLPEGIWWCFERSRCEIFDNAANTVKMALLTFSSYHKSSNFSAYYAWHANDFCACAQGKLGSAHIPSTSDSERNRTSTVHINTGTQALTLTLHIAWLSYELHS